MRLVGENVQIGTMVLYQGNRVVERHHVFLFRHLHQDRRLDGVQVFGRGKEAPTLGGFIRCAKLPELFQ